MPPSKYTTNRVYVTPVQIYSGMTNDGKTYIPPFPLTGGVYTVSVYRRCRHDFPNREQGKNECAPAAVLNSLEFLNYTFNLGIGADALTMKTFKAALGWTTNGVSADDWVAKKKGVHSPKGRKPPACVVQPTRRATARSVRTENEQRSLKMPFMRPNAIVGPANTSRNRQMRSVDSRGAH